MSLGPVDALRRIAFLLERTQAPTYRVKAFRGAAETVSAWHTGELERRVGEGSLGAVRGLGPKTVAVIEAAHRGETPDYLASLEADAVPVVDLSQTPGAVEFLSALRGDLHSHSTESDGGSPAHEMVATAIELGHEYLALTDHSPRLKVANGLSPERLRAQLDVVAAINEQVAPFRLLTGIEVDILDDGSLDQEPELLQRLDIVVASVHSKLRMDAPAMTRRMLAAVRNPLVDVLGHCTGRLVVGRQRPQSTFDAEKVFAACSEAGTAVEINCRPERLDPPRDLLRLAVQAGCLFSVDTDAHAPGQLDWRPYGVQRAVECGVSVEDVITSWPLPELLQWAGSEN